MMQLDVARVRLYLMPDTGNGTFRFVRPSGVSGSIPALRLRAVVNLTSHVQPGDPNDLRALPECVIDTGSPISLIPEYIWSHFIPGTITRLLFDPAMPLTLDNGTLTVPMIHGLRGGVIDVRTLRAEPDQGAPFGQAWILEDP